MSANGTCCCSKFHGPAQIRLVSGSTGIAAITRWTLTCPTGAGAVVGAGVGVAATLTPPTGVAVGLKEVKVAVGCGASVGAGAAVAGTDAAGAVVGSAAGAGAEVAVGSCPPHETITVTNMPTIHNGLKINFLIL